MTVCIAARLDGQTLFSSDSMLSSSDGEFGLCSDKVKKVSRNVALCTSGDKSLCLRLETLLVHVEYPKPKSRSECDDFLKYHISPYLRQNLEDRDKEASADCILAYGPALAVVEADGAVLPIANDLAAIGTGSPYALGALHKRKLSRMALHRAVLVACDLNLYCAPPVHHVEIAHR